MGIPHLSVAEAGEQPTTMASRKIILLVILAACCLTAQAKKKGKGKGKGKNGGNGGGGEGGGEEGGDYGMKTGPYTAISVTQCPSVDIDKWCDVCPTVVMDCHQPTQRQRRVL